MVPPRLARTLARSVLLFRLLGTCGNLWFGLRFAFPSAPMFVHAGSAATPFSNDVEGMLHEVMVYEGRVYLRPRQPRWAVTWKVQSEAITYGLLFGGLAAWLLF